MELEVMLHPSKSSQNTFCQPVSAMVGALIGTFAFFLSFIYGISAHADLVTKNLQKFAHYETLPDDGMTWDFNTSEPVFSIGDVHGNYKGAISILRRLKLIDSEGNWSGGRAHLVFNGDLFHGHKDSRLVIEMIMRIQNQAEEAGGKVHVVLGNHDLIVASGDESRFSKDEAKLYLNHPVDGNRYDRLREVLLDSKFSKWIASQNQIVRINGRIYVHAGLHGWAIKFNPGQINSTGRAWIKYWQGYSGAPKASTGWVVGVKNGKFIDETGPSWTRAYKVRASDDDLNYEEDRNPGAPKKKLLSYILSTGQWKAESIVIGHSNSPDYQLITTHPYYGEMVYMVDTGISRENGNLTALKIHGEIVETMYFDPKKKAVEIRNLEMSRIRNRCQKLFLRPTF